MSKCSNRYNFQRKSHAFEHFDILCASNGHSYQKLYPFEVKFFFRKKAFRQYEWRDPPRGQQLANSTSESTRHRHVSNSPTPLASPLQKQTPWKKFQNSPFWELVSKRDLVWAIYLNRNLSSYRSIKLLKIHNI